MDNNPQKEQQKEQRPHMPPVVIKALTITAALVLCALVYVFVDMRVQNTTPPITVMQTSAPTQKPTPTPPLGLRKTVMIERLRDSGLYVVKTEDANTYLVSLTEAETPTTLTISLQSGYVRGFSLQLDGKPRPDIAKKPSAIELKLQAAYAQYIANEEARLQEMLPKLLDALAPEGYFPPATTLAWVEQAIVALIDGEMARETQHGYAFTAIYALSGKLTLAVGAE